MSFACHPSRGLLLAISPWSTHADRTPRSAFLSSQISHGCPSLAQFGNAAMMASVKRPRQTRNVGTGEHWVFDIVTPEQLRNMLEARELLPELGLAVQAKSARMR